MTECTLIVMVVTSSTSAVATSSLLMAIEEARSEFLLQGSEIDHQNSDLWYLDMGAINHMTRKWNFFTKPDESAVGFVKFKV